MSVEKLMLISKRYDRIFDKIMKCALGSREHHRLLRIEDRLEHECTDELHRLGISTSSPCPKQSLTPCDKCNGKLYTGKTCHLKYPMDNL